jgi:hypothetical protein
VIGSRALKKMQEKKTGETRAVLRGEKIGRFMGSSAGTPNLIVSWLLL